MFFFRNEEDREINHHGKTVKASDFNADVENPEENMADLTMGGADIGNVINVLPAKTKNKVDPTKLISRNEKEQVAALRQHYANLSRNNNKKRLDLCHRFAHVYNPTMALSFVAVYWILGLRHADYI